MSHLVLIRDSELGKPGVHEFTLEMPSEEVTVHELMRSRVFQEVKDFNLKSRSEGQRYRGLVPAPELENLLNGSKGSVPVPVDWKVQFQKALQGFERKQFLVLVNEQQVESLDQRVEVQPDTVVSFLKLTPLVGG